MFIYLELWVLFLGFGVCLRDMGFLFVLTENNSVLRSIYAPAGSLSVTYCGLAEGALTGARGPACTADSNALRLATKLL